MAIERPRCDFKGAPPHPAKPAYMLVWKLPSGDVAKFSCAGHRFSFGGSTGYWVNEVECYEDNKGERVGTEKSASLPDARVDGRLGSDDKPLSGASCVDPECGKPAPYNGAWCDSCQSKWEDQQRATAKIERRSISIKAGF